MIASYRLLAQQLWGSYRTHALPAARHDRLVETPCARARATIGGVYPLLRYQPLQHDRLGSCYSVLSATVTAVTASWRRGHITSCCCDALQASRIMLQRMLSATRYRCYGVTASGYSPCSIVKLLVNMLALECSEFPAQRDDDATTCSPWSTVRGRYQRHDMFSLESLDTNYTYLPDVIERDTNYTTCSPWSIVDTNCTNVMSVGTVPWTLTVRCRVRRECT